MQERFEIHTFALIEDKNTKVRSFKTNKHICKKVDGPYVEVSMLSKLKDEIAVFGKTHLDNLLKLDGLLLFPRQHKNLPRISYLRR